MSTDHAQNPIDELRKPEHMRDGYLQVDVSDWCEHYGVDMALMPFTYRNYDPIEACRNIKDHLDGMHDLAQTFRAKDCNISHLTSNKTIKPLLRLYGVTEMRDTSKGMRYKNPQYEHYDACIQPISDMDERKEFYEQYQYNPYLGGEWYGKHWGISSKTAMNTIVGEFGYSLKADRDYGRKRLARTLHTITQWCDDRSQKEVCEIMPGEYSTVRDYIWRFAIDAEEWQPPERPTHQPWFRSD
jgi:hypothetical protein